MSVPGRQVQLKEGVRLREGELPQGNSESLGQALNRLLSSAEGSLISDQLARIVAEWLDLEIQTADSYRSLIRLVIDDFSRCTTREQIFEQVARLIQSRHSSGSPIVPMSHGLRPGDLVARLQDDPQITAALERLCDKLALAPAAEAPASKHAPETPDKHPSSPGGELRVNTAYRQHLDRQHDEIERLQGTLAQKVREAIVQNKEFGDLLKIERNALHQAEKVEEVSALRKILLDGVEELLQGQQALAENLEGTSDVLHLIENDSSRLHDELDKVRQLSLTDEATGLPNRRAFLRRLEDEMARAGRYHLPLSVAILDLDEFKSINDTYGHAAGDAILRTYAQQVLTIFRHHDMVARYGGEEFSVVLPGTTLDGAIAALRKVQAKAADTRCSYEDLTLPLPTFSCGLALFANGEAAIQILERADRTLYRAKHLGRNRILADQTDLARQRLEEKPPRTSGADS